MKPRPRVFAGMLIAGLSVTGCESDVGCARRRPLRA